MDWIYKIETLFERYYYKNQWKTIFATRQLKSGVLSWWKQFANVMPKGKARKISWENFLVQLKEEYYSKRDLLEIENEFQNLKKGKMIVREYATTFFEKIKLVTYLVQQDRKFC